uniref:CMP-N-acetylneuraminate-beta-galactosamide- alpha-2,3-sialyltransferase 4-like isoform X3 n=1 Tax=Pristiophorus japonicus TaxID=55135 RepID=UPI00398F1F18
MKCRADWIRKKCLQLGYAMLTLFLLFFLKNMLVGYLLRLEKFHMYIPSPLFRNVNMFHLDHFNLQKQHRTRLEQQPTETAQDPTRAETYRNSSRSDPSGNQQIQLVSTVPVDLGGPAEAPCQSWDSNNNSERIIANFTRNTDLFLRLGGNWWYQPNYVFHTLPYGIKGNEVIINQILSRTQSNMPDEIARLSCKRCVIVGNGNSLKNSSLGETINKYDIVIRLNSAPVRGYEKDVGNKTTLRIFYPESATEDLTVENSLDTLFVIIPFKSADVRWLKAIVYNEARVKKGFWRNPAAAKKLDPSRVRILNSFYMYQAAVMLLEQPSMIKTVCCGITRENHPTKMQPTVLTICRNRRNSNCCEGNLRWTREYLVQ